MSQDFDTFKKSLKGTVTLIGAGPGHPDLITVKGMRYLQWADVVVYDALLDETFQEVFPPEAERVFVGKRCGKHAMAQGQIHDLMIQRAQAGCHVVRLKGGDPFIFGRGGEEVLALRQAQIPVQVIPGVSAMNGVGTLVGIPLTHRELSNQVMFLECHRETIKRYNWPWLAQFEGTLILFMATKTLQTVAQELVGYGMAPCMPVAIVEAASMEAQTIHRSTLGVVADHGWQSITPGPGLVYIGDIVDLQPLLEPNVSAQIWFGPKAPGYTLASVTDRVAPPLLSPSAEGREGQILDPVLELIPNLEQSPHDR